MVLVQDEEKPTKALPVIFVPSCKMHVLFVRVWTERLWRLLVEFGLVFSTILNLMIGGAPVSTLKRYIFRKRVVMTSE